MRPIAIVTLLFPLLGFAQTPTPDAAAAAPPPPAAQWSFGAGVFSESPLLLGSTVSLGILREGRQQTIKVPVVKASGGIRRR